MPRRHPNLRHFHQASDLAEAVDSEWLRLDCGNAPLQAELTAQNIIPTASDTYTLGADANRWSTIFIGSIDGHNQPVNLGYTIVNAVPAGSLPSSIIFNEIGGLLYSGGTRTLTVNHNGGFLTSPPTNLNLLADTGPTRGANNVVMDFPNGGNLNLFSKMNFSTTHTATDTASNNMFATLLLGATLGTGTNDCTVRAQSTGFEAGNIVGGFAATIFSGSAALIEANFNDFFKGGTFVFGMASGGTLQGLGAGCFVSGEADDIASIIAGPGAGAMATGFATGAGSLIQAMSAGSFARGYAVAGAVISATGLNSTQFGVGVNAEADSLQVGGQLRFKGSVGPPVIAPIHNGDVWVTAGGQVTVQSLGFPVTLRSAAAAWTTATFVDRRNMATLTAPAGGNAVSIVELQELVESLVEDLQAMNIIT